MLKWVILDFFFFSFLREYFLSWYVTVGCLYVVYLTELELSSNFQSPNSPPASSWRTTQLRSSILLAYCCFSPFSVSHRHREPRAQLDCNLLLLTSSLQATYYWKRPKSSLRTFLSRFASLSFTLPTSSAQRKCHRAITDAEARVVFTGYAQAVCQCACCRRTLCRFSLKLFHIFFCSAPISLTLVRLDFQ